MLMVTWGLLRVGVLEKLRTFVDTHIWNKNRYVGICGETIDSNVEYYIFDLLFDYASIEYGFLLYFC